MHMVTNKEFLLEDDDPRNEDDYDTWEYGTEPVPGDHTWHTEEKNKDSVSQ